MNTLWDVIIIGAGPAGMSAAITLSQQGLQVCVIDEQDTPGGQIYRNISAPQSSMHFLEEDSYQRGKVLVQRFLESSITYLPRTTAWAIEPHHVVCLQDDICLEFKALDIILATGAMERPVPFPGWTLPGVMTAGAADILHKTTGTFPHGPIVLAGSGPLLLQTAEHLLRKNADLAAIADMTPPSNFFKAFPWTPLSLADPEMLQKGLTVLRSISHVRFYHNIRNLKACGKDHLEKVAFISRGKEYTITATTLLVHNGIIPRTHASRVMRLPHAWNNIQKYWQVQADISGKAAEHIYIVGDCLRVYGEKAAILRGKITALQIAYNYKLLTPKELRKAMFSLWIKYMQVLSARPMLSRAFSPRRDLYDVPDDVVVCRCENITAGSIRAVALEGLADINEVKLRTRSGMGSCQGRMCEAASAAIAASVRKIRPQDMDKLSIRNPLRAVPLEVLARLHEEKN